MIDIDKLQKVADRAIKIGAEKEQLFSAEEVISVFTRLRQSEKDAARYRFMRDMSDGVDVSRFFHIEVSERDAEIDGDMQCNK